VVSAAFNRFADVVGDFLKVEHCGRGIPYWQVIGTPERRRVDEDRVGHNTIQSVVAAVAILADKAISSQLLLFLWQIRSP
jgi:hypothetical protein